MIQPTKEEAINKLSLILQNKLSREEVADWASEYVMHDDPDIHDDIVWDILIIISGVDLKNGPNEYLHVEQDIKNWINEYASK